jgi:hypothetical protein
VAQGGVHGLAVAQVACTGARSGGGGGMVARTGSTRGVQWHGAHVARAGRGAHGARYARRARGAGGVNIWPPKARVQPPSTVNIEENRGRTSGGGRSACGYGEAGSRDYAGVADFACGWCGTGSREGAVRTPPSHRRWTTMALTWGPCGRRLVRPASRGDMR